MNPQPQIGEAVFYCLDNGNNVGDVRPATIVRVWPDAQAVNLAVFTDFANDNLPTPYWAPARLQGTGPGHWSYTAEGLIAAPAVEVPLVEVAPSIGPNAAQAVPPSPAPVIPDPPVPAVEQKPVPAPAKSAKAVKAALAAAAAKAADEAAATADAAASTAEADAEAEQSSPAATAPSTTTSNPEIRTAP